MALVMSRMSCKKVPCHRHRDAIVNFDTPAGMSVPDDTGRKRERPTRKFLLVVPAERGWRAHDDRERLFRADGDVFTKLGGHDRFPYLDTS